MLCRDVAASAEWIDSDAGLRAAAASWETVIGLDTEFQRTNTFHPLPGLYQVVSGERIYLIDPLAVTDFQPLVEVLEDPRRTVIMHACGEDLELLSHHLGAVPTGLFDTQLANAFQSGDYATSYAKLVARVLAVGLDKHETRSDWLARPLSEEQQRYACEDVIHLPALHAELDERLTALDRRHWFAETMADQGRWLPTAPEDYYRGVKKAWQLSGRQLGVLRALCTWRERRARSEDLPRNRIVWDEHLFDFARRKTLREGDVWGLLPKPVARRYAAELVAEHARALDEEPPPPLPRPLTQAQGAVSKALREFGRDRADALDLAQELLARKRDVEACVRHYLDHGEVSPGYSGWRWPVVGEAFQEKLGRLL